MPLALGIIDLTPLHLGSSSSSSTGRWEDLIRRQQHMRGSQLLHVLRQAASLQHHLSTTAASTAAAAPACTQLTLGPAAAPQQPPHPQQQQQWQRPQQQWQPLPQLLLLQHQPQLQQPQQQQPQQQQVRAYHPATHAARGLTSKLLQQKSWQDLRMVFDASGGGAKLNPIQLSALLQQLCKLAPAPGLLTAAERSSLGSFVDEVTSVCWSKLQRFDATGLASVVSSTLKLGGTLYQQQGDTMDLQHSSSSASSSSASSSSSSSSSSSTSSSNSSNSRSSSSRVGQVPDALRLHAQLLAAATKQVAYADAHTAGVLLAALTRWQQQQGKQQQQLSAQDVQQQALGWQLLLAALTQRLQACVALRQLNSADASKLCLTTSKLAGLLAKLRSAAHPAAVVGASQHLASGLQHHTQEHQLQEEEDAQGILQQGELEGAGQGQSQAQPEATSAAAEASAGAAEALSTAAAAGQVNLQQSFNQLQHACRTLLALAAQQVVPHSSSDACVPSGPSSSPNYPAAAAAAAASPADTLANTSRVVYALAKTWAWPGWPSVLGLVQQYSTALQAADSILAAAAAAEHEGRQFGGKRRKQRQQLGPPAFLLMDSSSSSSGSVAGGGGVSGSREGDAEAAEAAAAAAAAAELSSAVRDSLGPMLWAVGRLVEQQRQRHQQQLQRKEDHKQQQQQQVQQQELLQQELQHHAQLWSLLGPMLIASQQQLQWWGPLQLVQVASGLGKLVHSSNTLSDTAAAAAAPRATEAAGGATGAGVAVEAAAGAPAVAHAGCSSEAQQDGSRQALQPVLLQEAPELSRLLQQHVGRVQALLPLLALQHRLQLATAYQHLELQLPRLVADLFARDAAVQQRSS